ncbi:E3 ubiquitin-protein ligase RNF167 [Paramormyrops kingsleyae]|uniref:E3 ubiquitin-protein ligase RNF167 n=1 Tax=Paramormyrops kingsleyae TaxID=1676925 RepID=UPI003B97798E
MSPLGSRGAQLTALVGALCCMVAPPTVHSSIYAHDGNSTSMVFEDQPSFFGGRLPKDGLMGILVESRPLNACVPIDPPPHAIDRNATKYIVIIRRFDCNFDVKVLHAEQAGYSAAIVYNVHSDSLLNMASDNDTISGQIEIPSVFTSHTAFLSLKEYIIPEAGSYVILWPEFTFPLIYYLIPFTGVMGMIILIMVTILVVRCVQHRKRARRNRLTKEQLKKIPVHKFKKGDEYDMCAICLDEYEDGDKLRILPCSHAYHCRCVDPWLTQTKKTCPVCKQRVIQPDTESEEEDEEEEGRGAREEADTERTPLLRPSRPGSPSSSDGPGVYSSTAECSGPGLCSDSPLLAHEGYYSPEEGDSDDEEEEEDEASLSEGETARLLGRGEVQL